MIEALEQYIGAARWFGGKGRPFTVTAVHPLAWLEAGEATPRVRIELAEVTYEDGQETYQLPLAYYPEPQERLEHALVGTWEDETLGQVYVYDALADRDATCHFLRAFDDRRSGDGLVFHRLTGHDLDLGAQGALFSGEQSNSSVRFGDDSLMKAFRKVTPGVNPDIEIHEVLTRAGVEHVAALYGWLEATPSGDGADGGEPLHLAMLQQFLRTASDGWELALASVRDLYAEGDLHADEVGGDFASESHRLGVATAEVHAALAVGFPTETWGPAELGRLAAQMQQRLDEALPVVPALEPHAEALREAFAAVAAITGPVPVQRVHGDFHLGQTLRTVKNWKIVDFEGEPAKPLAERRRPDSRWRDVAGMLRSFDYAAHAVEADVEADSEEDAQLAYRAVEWVERNQQAFLAGYAEGRAHHEDTGAESGELSDEERTLLRAYVLDKAVYETVYETRNRPDWLAIPLASVERLVAPAPDPDPAEATDR